MKYPYSTHNFLLQYLIFNNINVSRETFLHVVDTEHTIRLELREEDNSFKLYSNLGEFLMAAVVLKSSHVFTDTSFSIFFKNGGTDCCTNILL